MEASGTPLWWQIRQTLGDEIEKGVYPADRRLPSSLELARRFGVNRHTVLRAIAHLKSDGVVRMERGRGTYAVVNRHQYRLESRTWFEQNLLASDHRPARKILSVRDVPADDRVAAALGLQVGDAVVLVDILGEADDTPFNLSSHFFPTARLPGVAATFRAYGHEPTDRLTFSAVFRSLGIDDWRRNRVHIRSRRATGDETHRLQLASGGHVLETEIVSVDGAGVPLVYALTRYDSASVEFVMDL